jgi:hypothetical protein
MALMPYPIHGFRDHVDESDYIIHGLDTFSYPSLIDHVGESDLYYSWPCFLILSMAFVTISVKVTTLSMAFL